MELYSLSSNVDDLDFFEQDPSRLMGLDPDGPDAIEQHGTTYVTVHYAGHAFTYQKAELAFLKVRQFGCLDVDR